MPVTTREAGNKLKLWQVAVKKAKKALENLKAINAQLP